MQKIMIKLKDIVEVWFDSGSTHSVLCLEKRADLEMARAPYAYLEGSDQHRGVGFIPLC